MRDVMKLRGRLETMVGIVTLAPVALGGCEPRAGEIVSESKPSPKATTKPEPKSTAAPTTAPTPSVPPELPTGFLPSGGGGCPPVDWCGPASEAKVVEAKGAVGKLGCPSEVQTSPAWKGPYFAYGSLDEAKTKAARLDAGGSTCCYSLRRLCGGGRPLVDGDVVRVAALRPGRAWHAPLDGPSLDEVPAGRRRAVGEGWLRDARMEHASIASFARASLELMVLGAPPELLADCSRAALDEIRHAQRCFALASHWLGRDVEPGALHLPAARAVTLAEVARATLLEGCVGETVAALVATRAAAGCEDACTRGVLEEIAADETAHAALAFRILSWCLETGGDDVRSSLPALRMDGEGSDAIEGLEAHGRLGGAAVTRATEEALSLVVAPLLASLAAGGPGRHADA